MDTTAAAAAKSLQSCPTLCDPTDGSPPCYSVPRILWARVLEGVAISFPNACMHAKLLQSCPTICDPMDSSPPGSSVLRILQARTLESIATSFSNTWTHMLDNQDFPGSSVVKNLLPNEGSARDVSFIPELGGSRKEETKTHSSILVWKSLGDWQTIVHEVTESDLTECLSIYAHNYLFPLN